MVMNQAIEITILIAATSTINDLSVVALNPLNARTAGQESA
ncbi:unannotated protein [freshwater metagenome]|uniref:Unannotated protein n=1 Tax=freshwater metagenome TaxID=449393 RepID=A0A6J6NV51_9ZZZZ